MVGAGEGAPTSQYNAAVATPQVGAEHRVIPMQAIFSNATADAPQDEASSDVPVDEGRGRPRRARLAMLALSVCLTYSIGVSMGGDQADRRPLQQRRCCWPFRVWRPTWPSASS